MPLPPFPVPRVVIQRFGGALAGTAGGGCIATGSAVDVAALARAYPWPRRGVICDVAGGIGTLLAEILGRRKRARGILLDPAGVLAEAERFLARRGLSHRVELVPGDLFGVLHAEADVYVLKWILHERYTPTFAHPVTTMVDLQMLVACEGGRERTPEHVHRLMAESGLTPGEVRHAGFHMLVEGRA